MKFNAETQLSNQTTSKKFRCFNWICQNETFWHFWIHFVPWNLFNISILLKDETKHCRRFDSEFCSVPVFRLFFWKFIIEDSSSWQYQVYYGYAFSLLQNNFYGWKGCRLYIKICKSWRNRWNFEGWAAVSNSHKNKNSEIPCLICPPVFPLEGNTQLLVLTIPSPNEKFKLFPALL